MKERFSKLIDVKSLVTLTMTLAMILMLTGVFTPPTEIFALFSTAYGSVITYFFTKKDDKDNTEADTEIYTEQSEPFDVEQDILERVEALENEVYGNIDDTEEEYAEGEDAN